MLRLLTPCRVVDDKQVAAKNQLLKEYAAEGYCLGIEIVGRWEDFFCSKNVDQIRRNLTGLSAAGYFSLHAPYKVRGDWERNFFSSEKGISNLLHILDLADELNVQLVNLHASLFHTYRGLKKAYAAGLEDYRKDLLRNVKAVLQEVSPHRNQRICLENMPSAWDHDVAPDPLKMIYEVCFVDPQDFLAVINPERNVFATIDTCHLAAVYDSSQLLGGIKKIGRGLGHVHLSDLKGNWQPFLTLAEEGKIPGEGRIGERVFRGLLGYFLEFSQNQDLSLVLEINDRNYVQPEESRESFARVINWLNEIKAAQ